MADEVDITSEREELTIRSAMITSKKPAGPAPTGFCNWCEDPLAEDYSRFCCVECRDDWDSDQKRRGR